MKPTRTPPPVVVGIDGSPSAVRAAEWAVNEAASRDVPLRLVHVIQSTAADVSHETDLAVVALDDAQSAVRRKSEPVKVETAIVRGPVVATLVAESRGAAMICLGSAGCRRQASRFIGNTGTAVSQSASCPVAVVRTLDGAPSATTGAVAVIVDEPTEVDAILSVALAEARLRQAPLLVLNVTSARIRELAPEEVDGDVAEWLGGHPEVPSRVVMLPDDVATFIGDSVSPIALAVVANGVAASQVLGPYGRFVLRGSGCSVLMVPTHG